MRLTCLFVYLPFRAVHKPLRNFYWHKTFDHPLSANETHKTPSNVLTKINAQHLLHNVTLT